MNYRHAWPLLVIVIVSVYLSFVHLDNAYYWDDEAHVSIIARNFLKTGQLTGWDGRNLVGYRNGTFIDKNLRTINAPLDCLVTAASFQILGISTWAGRFPYVLAGLASLVVFILLLHHDFSDNPWLQGYAFACLAGSVNFLLYIRTCRYYALSLLFSLLIYYAYRRCLTSGRLRYFLILSASAILSFYSNYLLCGAFLLALLLSHLIFHRRDFSKKGTKNGSNISKFLVAAVLFLIATVPYAMRYKAAAYPTQEMPPFAVNYRSADHPKLGEPEPWQVRKPVLLWWNLRELNSTNSLPWVMALGLICFLLRRRQTPNEGTDQHSVAVRAIVEWAVLSLGYVFFLSMLSPQSLQLTSLANTRFLVPAIPFLAGLVGVFLWQVHQHTQWGALLLLIIYLNTNLLTLNPRNDEFRWLLPAYVQEVHQPYPTAYHAVDEFLKQHAWQDDTVFAYPDYTNYPILFYSGERVRLSCLLDYRTPLPHEVIRSLHAPLFIEENFPDWFIAFTFRPHTTDLLKHFTRAHREQGRMVYFPYRLVRILDVNAEQTQRPELPWHSFGPDKEYYRYVDAVYVYRREPPRDATHGVPHMEWQPVRVFPPANE